LLCHAHDLCPSLASQHASVQRDFNDRQNVRRAARNPTRSHVCGINASGIAEIPKGLCGCAEQSIVCKGLDYA
jgi:hypothetical protein